MKTPSTVDKKIHPLVQLSGPSPWETRIWLLLAQAWQSWLVRNHRTFSRSHSCRDCTRTSGCNPAPERKHMKTWQNLPCSLLNGKMCEGMRRSWILKTFEMKTFGLEGEEQKTFASYYRNEKCKTHLREGQPQTWKAHWKSGRRLDLTTNGRMAEWQVWNQGTDFITSKALDQWIWGFRLRMRWRPKVEPGAVGTSSPSKKRIQIGFVRSLKSSDKGGTVAQEWQASPSSGPVVRSGTKVCTTATWLESEKQHDNKSGVPQPHRIAALRHVRPPTSVAWDLIKSAGWWWIWRAKYRKPARNTTASARFRARDSAPSYQHWANKSANNQQALQALQANSVHWLLD